MENKNEQWNCLFLGRRNMGDIFMEKEDMGFFRHLSTHEKHKGEILCNTYVPLCLIQFLGLSSLYGKLGLWGPLVVFWWEGRFYPLFQVGLCYHIYLTWLVEVTMIATLQYMMTGGSP